MSTTALCIASSAIATEQAASFESRIEATLTRAGTEATHFVFTRKGDQLRIENTTNKLEPINIVDLVVKKVTIVYPHNTTFVRVDVIKKAAQPGVAPLPPGFPAPPKPNSVGQAVDASPARTFSGTTQPSPIGPRISPPPSFPSPPNIAGGPPGLPGQMPPMPNNPGAAGMPPMPQKPVGGSPTGAGGSRDEFVRPANGPPARGGQDSALQMPMPPPMPGMFGAAELKKTDKTKKIQGFDCTLYTISGRAETFEIWATNDAALFPFQLIEREYIGRRFGPQMLEEQWPALLREKSLFPLEGTLKMEPNAQERLSFKVDKIEKKQITDDKLFQPPDGYHEIQAPQF